MMVYNLNLRMFISPFSHYHNHDQRGDSKLIYLILSVTVGLGPLNLKARVPLLLCENRLLGYENASYNFQVLCCSGLDDSQAAFPCLQGFFQSCAA